jgi:hypothetical protein
MKSWRWLRLLMIAAALPLLYLPLRAAEPPPSPPPAGQEASPETAPKAQDAEADEEESEPEPADDEAPQENISADNNLTFPVDI